MWSLVILVAMVVTSTRAELFNEQVDRSIDLSTHLVVVTTNVTIRNTGAEAISEVAIVQGPQNVGVGKLAFLAVTDADHRPLAVVGGNGSELVQLRIAAGETTHFNIREVYIHAQTPFPKRIAQGDTQLVKFSGNHFYPSPYPTREQTTYILLPGRVEAASQRAPFHTDGTTLTYGPYTNTAANSYEEMALHFENNSPFLTISQLVREVRVPAWGSVVITDTVQLEHDGALLEGSFSRADLTRSAKSGRNAVRAVKALLPAHATDVQYYDLIGNISTSHMRAADDGRVTLEMRPRFPLLGGWKTSYSLSYTLPRSSVLREEGTTHTLQIPFIGHLYEHQVIDTAELRILLPEGAADIQTAVPFPIDSQTTEVQMTTLDLFGRPVLALRASDLIDEHERHAVEVTYTFSSILLLRVPLMIGGGVALVVMLVSLLTRVDFSIDGSKAKQE